MGAESQAEYWMLVCSHDVGRTCWFSSKGGGRDSSLNFFFWWGNGTLLCLEFQPSPPTWQQKWLERLLPVLSGSPGPEPFSVFDRYLLHRNSVVVCNGWTPLTVLVNVFPRPNFLLCLPPLVCVDVIRSTSVNLTLSCLSIFTAVVTSQVCSHTLLNQ